MTAATGPPDDERRPPERETAVVSIPVNTRVPLPSVRATHMTPEPAVGAAATPSCGFPDIDELAAGHGGRWRLAKLVRDRGQSIERRRAAANLGARLAIEDDVPSGPDNWYRWAADPDSSPPPDEPTPAGAAGPPPEAEPSAYARSTRDRHEAFEQEARELAKKKLVNVRADELVAEQLAAASVIDTRPIAERLNLLNFAALGAEDEPDPPFVLPRLAPAGSALAIYSPQGLGKSLLAQEGAVAVAMGGEFLGQPVVRRHVLYVDLENPKSSIRDRFESFGVPLNDELTSWLHYSHLADWAPLDTHAGGAALVRAALELGAQLVILDTTMRGVSGEENSADTYAALYTHTVLPLKKHGIAFLRLDHSGKDVTKGMRGSSAKGGDVDLIYRLQETAKDRVTLIREKNRPHLSGPDQTALQRTSDPLRHVVVSLDAKRGLRHASEIVWVLSETT